MKIKVAEATNIQLNFMVAKTTGMALTNHDGSVFWGNFATVTPTTNWAQAGPIIDREGITVSKEQGEWSAYFRDNLFNEDGTDCWQVGPTPLVAAMRCFVASKLGEEVEVPDELTT